MEPIDFVVLFMFLMTTVGVGFTATKIVSGARRLTRVVNPPARHRR